MCPPLASQVVSSRYKTRVTRVVRYAVVHSSADQSLASLVLDTFDRQKVPAGLMCPDDNGMPASLEESEVRHRED